ncbi:hypothetical protein RhiirC2_798612 [Rhizophagus irregularis]|uniref:Uncharacterized protein n=1 Tax=Rhizophagus irregularis TaxID=588596 RepID=A0A2N1M672_9GLOM|nr:hypothetical protein RhiirC2_798612 [Rhizophagus irregularis]
MVVVLKAKVDKNLNFKVPDKYNVCIYFKKAQLNILEYDNNVDETEKLLLLDVYYL